MNIGELARQAEVTPRTIRYYVEQGLLPPPERGYPAEYTEQHAERLELIRLLKDERMPLEEIKATVGQLTPSEVRDLLGKARERAATRPVEPTDSAAEYISRLLQNSQEREAMLESHTRKPLPLPPPQYLGPPVSSAAPEPATQPLAGAPAPTMPLPKSPAPLQAPGAQAPGQAPMQDAGTWQRIQLTPAVEIHYQVAAGDEHRNLVDRLVELAARILGRGPEKGS